MIRLKQILVATDVGGASEVAKREFIGPDATDVTANQESGGLS
jgi:hypothetical protein